MAITATTAISSATAKPGQRRAVTITITNSGGSSVNVTGCVPTMKPTGATLGSAGGALGMPNLGPGMTVAVAGSNGTLKLNWDVVAHSPSSGEGLAAPAEQVYDVGATVYTSDGAITVADTTTLTVSSPDLN